MGYCKTQKLEHQAINVPYYVSVTVENTDTII